MDEGEHDHAYSFDFHNHMAIFVHSLNVAFIALELSGGDPDPLICAEFILVEYLAARRIIGSEQSEQFNAAFCNRADTVLIGIAVDPERKVDVGVFAS